MTRLIKFPDAATSNIRPLHAGAASPAPPRKTVKPSDTRTAALQLELQQARQTLEDKDAEIAKLLEAIESAYKDGESDGRKAAREAAEDERETLLAALDDAANKAVEAMRVDMASLERLAVLLAIESLNKILGEPGAFADIAPRLIQNQMARLDPLSVVRMQVSPADFPDDARLAALAAGIGHPGLEIIAADDLKSGDCRINLVLGTLDVGLNQQWGQLRAVLEDLAEPGTGL